MARPKGDLGALAMSKEERPPSQPAGVDPAAYAHALSLRLTMDQYRRLRRYVAQQEDLTGRRITHQAVIVAALMDFLDRAGG
jgi:hypothetical protein